MATKSKLECALWQTEDVSVECKSCDVEFCNNCDELFHNHPNTQKHKRKVIVSSSFVQCNCCGSENVECFCLTCENQQHLCASCDCKFHTHQKRQGHVRKQFRHLSALIVDDGIHCCNCHSICTVECKDCNKSFCSDCDEKYHDYPNLEEHTRKELKRVCSFCEGLYITVRCDECCGWYCNRCDEVRHENKLAKHTRKAIKERTPKEEIICGLEEEINELTKSIEVYKTSLQQHNIEKEEIVCGLELQITELKESVEEYETALEQLNFKKDSIVHEKKAQIQALENNFKSLQDRHEMEKVQHNREIQTKESLIEEQIAKARRQKEQTESLEKENRDLQNQNNTLKIQVTGKEVELQRYLSVGVWKKCSDGDVPEDGVEVLGGSEVYVCRAEVDGDVVPGWIRPFDKVCRVYHNGEAYDNYSYEVLVPNSSFEWISCRGDEIPPRAVPCGKTKGGEVLYIGRIKDTDQYYYVGKVQPSLNGCYNVPYVNGDFTIHPNYVILVWK